MSDERFAAIFFILVADLVKRLVGQGENARDAIRSFYRSKVYRLLSDRETGLWHASTEMLLALYDEERRTGDFPCDWCV